MSANNLKKVLLFLFLFFLPTQFGYHFWPESSLVRGIRVDYLSPTIYFSDILLLSLIILDTSNIVAFVLNRKKHVFIFVFFILINTFYSVSPQTSLFRVTTLFLCFLLYAFISKNIALFRKVAPKPIFYSLLTLCLLSILQWIKGRSIDGIFYYLGERHFTLQTPGIALSKLGTEVFLRPYATLPHPNALAGFLLVEMLLLYKLKKLYFWILCAPALFVLVLTQSYSAWIALLVVLLCLPAFKHGQYLTTLIQKLFVTAFYAVSIISPILLRSLNISLSKNSFERVQLSVAAGEIISKNFWIGLGVGNFIHQISRYIDSNVLLLQPVHNVPLLLFSEAGIVGTLLSFLFLMQIPLSSEFVIITITSLFDHYWFTLHQTILLASCVMAYLSSKNQYSKKINNLRSRNS